MMVQGTKVATKDVDVVLRSNEMMATLVRSMRGLGYHPKGRLSAEYQALEASAILERADGMRFDVFVTRVCKVVALTEGMVERAVDYPLQGLLRLRVVRPEDIFILKSVTERDGDAEDMVTLARSGLDWEAMATEVRTQPDSWRWLARFYARLSELEAERELVSPLTGMFRDDAEIVAGIAVVLPHLDRSRMTLREVQSLLGEGDNEFPSRVMERMLELGLARLEEGRYTHAGGR
jgi:hypothetical protein